MSATAMRAQANRRTRLASYAVLATAATGVVASGSSLTFLLGAVQVVAAAVALVKLRTGGTSKAIGWVGLALVAGVASLADSAPSLDPTLLALDLLNVVALGLGWRWTNAAATEERAAYAAEKRAILEGHERDRTLDRGLHDRARRARLESEDELIYIDDLADSPRENV